MGRAGIWIGVVAVVGSSGCGEWQLRRHAALPPPEPAPYVWQEEGTFPAPPEAAAAPASAASAASTTPAEDTILFAPETPTFTVEALPAAAAAEAASPAAANGPGVFRVQVFASRSREAAEAIRDDLTARFRAPTRLDFEAPYYKVRAGECSSDAACQELRSELRGAGYSAAYIVPAVALSP